MKSEVYLKVFSSGDEKELVSVDGGDIVLACATAMAIGIACGACI